MSKKDIQVVRVRTPGPVTNLGTSTPSAVWPGDSVEVKCRLGSRRLCRVTYRHGDRVTAFVALVPKRWLRWLRVHRQSAKLSDCGGTE